MNKNNDKTKANVYEIRIKGHLDRHWSAWFDDFTMVLENDGTTTLKGKAEDQSSLYGLLKKIRDTGVPLLSVNIVKEENK